ncbi:MAG: TIGR00725 family protein [Methanoregulaceae archaeon]|nr:MAG: TIGR00725 family protein [Methanoregulaceae archaeon]
MQIAVIGHGQASSQECEAAYATGRTIAENGAVLVCGGLGGVMEAACRGAQEAGGITVGILPGTEGGNPYLDITIPTGLGIARNAVVVLSGDAVIAVGGIYGTLSEIAIALKTGRPVYGIHTWDIEGVIPCSSPEEAVTRAMNEAARHGTA